MEKKFEVGDKIIDINMGSVELITDIIFIEQHRYVTKVIKNRGTLGEISSFFDSYLINEPCPVILWSKKAELLFIKGKL